MKSTDEYYDLQNLGKEDQIIYLMRKYGEEIKRLVYTFVKNWEQASDITQDVFVSVYTKMDHFRGEANLRTWIYSIAINKSKDYLKSWHFRRIYITDKINQLAQGKEQPALRSVSIHEDSLLTHTLLEQPIKYREILILYYYKEFTVKEISRLLNVKESTVKTRLLRARDRLKHSYIKKGGKRNGE